MKNQGKLLLKGSTTQLNREKEGHHILSKRVLFTQENGREDLETVKVNRSGLMVLVTLESGEKTGLMAEANLYTLMVISMMDSGQMTKPMDTASTCT